MSETVFVYGTLKKGGHNHYLLSDCIPLGEGVTSTSMTLLDLGAFPGVDISRETSQIQGEVYKVSSLKDLDRLEGYPRFYNRKLVATTRGIAWIYFLDKPGRYDHSPIINGGYWEADRRLRDLNLCQGGRDGA